MKLTTKIYFGDQEIVHLPYLLAAIPRPGEGFTLKERPQYGTCTVKEVGHDVSMLPTRESHTVVIYLDPE